MRLHFVGPAGVDVERHLPPGSESFQTELAPSGHIVLPCCEYKRGSIDKDHTLTLLTQKNPAPGSGSQMAEAVRGQETGVVTMIPPPPPKPPVLPETVNLSTVLPAPLAEDL